MKAAMNLKRVSSPDKKIDTLLSMTSPYLSEINDDIPILDVLIGAGSKPGYFKASAAIYLDDETLKTSSEHISPNTALNRALEYLTEKVAQREQSKKHFQKLVKKVVSAANTKATTPA